MWPYNYFGDFWDKLGSIPDLLQSTKPVRAANKTIIGVKGYFEATITSQHASKQLKISAMNADQVEPPLMSRDDLFDLGYLPNDPFGAYAANSGSQDQCSSEEEFKKAVAEIHKTYQCVFQGVGQYCFHTVDLKLKPDQNLLSSVPFLYPCTGTNLQKSVRMNLCG